LLNGKRLAYHRVCGLVAFRKLGHCYSPGYIGKHVRIILSSHYQYNRYLRLSFSPIRTHSLYMVLLLTRIYPSLPVLRDATFVPAPIDPIRFPGAPPLTTVHAAFQDGHQLTAATILAAVKQVIAERSATKVTTVGHSLGGALAVLDGLYLRLNLPANVQVVTRTFGQPRVGLLILRAGKHNDTHLLRLGMMFLLNLWT
jgi:pimeloyl-ACP methyl ester carboxylesterase